MRVEVNKQRFLNRVKENTLSVLYDYELKGEPGLGLVDALTPMGEEIEKGEQEVENLIDEILLQVELALQKPKRRRKKEVI